MRLIARLDIKNDYLMKSIKYDGVRKIGNIISYAEKYYLEGIDELIITNVTGSLYKTKLDVKILKEIRKIVHIPISGGGGINSLEDAEILLNNGCDKIIINSIIHQNIKEAKKIIKHIGSSSVVGSIQYTDVNSLNTHFRMGRDNTGICLKDTIRKYNEIGVGEILLTNISREGTYSNLDRDIVFIANSFKYFPLLIGGGFKSPDELDLYKDKVSAVVLSSALHYNKTSIKKLLFKNI